MDDDEDDDEFDFLELNGDEDVMNTDLSSLTMDNRLMSHKIVSDGMSKLNLKKASSKKPK